MTHEPSRWRIRISTLMLLIVIAALASALVAEKQWKQHMALARERAMAQLAQAEARRAAARAAAYIRALTARQDEAEARLSALAGRNQQR
jgi:ABC-type sugar transport system ATPase subunit